VTGEPIDGQEMLTEPTGQGNARLVQAIAQGDSEAEGAFVNRYLRPVKFMLLARSNDPDLTVDLVQDVMIEAICSLRKGRLRDPEKLTHFVIGIARNLLNNHYRIRMRRPEPVELPANLPDLAPASVEFEEQQRETLAMSAISSLEPVDRTILKMTLVDGLKPGVIAERLGLSSDVVRQRKLRAIRRVTELVRGESQRETSGHNTVGRARS